MLFFFGWANSNFLTLIIGERGFSAGQHQLLTRCIGRAFPRHSLQLAGGEDLGRGAVAPGHSNRAGL